MRFSLKTFLLTTTLFGAGCGMFVHFKNNNPEGLFYALNLVPPAVPAVLAYVTVFVVGLFGSAPRNRLLLMWGAILIAAPALNWAILKTIASRGPFGMVASDQLVSVKFAGQFDEPTIWVELAERAKRGELTVHQIQRAIESLVIAVEEAAAGSNPTLSSEKSLRAPSIFFETAAVEKVASPADLARLLDIRNGTPTVKKPGVRINRENCGDVSLTIEWGTALGPYYRRGFHWTAEFFLDGKPAQTEQLSGMANLAQVYITDVPKGEHEIRVDFIRTYIPSSAGNGGFTTSPVKSWNVSKDYPLKTIPVTLKVTVP